MKTKAQSTVEFTFALIVIMFLIYGMVQVFRWAGMDLAQRQYSQDTSLTNMFVNTVTVDMGIYGNYTMDFYDPTSELNADLDSVLPLAAVYHGKLTNGNNPIP